MTDKTHSLYLTEAERLLTNFYLQNKNTGKEDKKEHALIQGFMHAGLISGIVCKDDLNLLISNAHHQVFGMSLHDRNVKKILDGKNSQYFDSPTYIRLYEKARLEKRMQAQTRHRKQK